MEVAVQCGDDGVSLMVPPLQHSLGLQLDNNYYVQWVGVEVVIRRGTHIDKALDVAAGLCHAHFTGIFGCANKQTSRGQLSECAQTEGSVASVLVIV